jgi:hypothetical protein
MAKATEENITGNPFARGPMSGSAMEILSNLHASAAVPTTGRHLDARLIELGKQCADLTIESERNEAEQCAIERLVAEEFPVPAELLPLATGLPRQSV